jgi:hypothetical protein
MPPILGNGPKKLVVVSSWFLVMNLEIWFDRAQKAYIILFVELLKDFTRILTCWNSFSLKTIGVDYRQEWKVNKGVTNCFLGHVQWEVLK